MIKIECGECDREPVDVTRLMALPADKLAEAIGELGFERCGHCGSYYHRIQCFTFHKAPADRPVLFVNRAAERTERRRLARLDAA